MKIPVSKIIKVVLSIRLKEILDKNKDGRVSWREIRTASTDDWITILGEVGMRAISVFELVKFL